MDEIDVAQEYAERQLAICIAAARKTTAYPEGRCMWCEESLPSGHFCKDNSCAEDFQRHMTLMKQRGL